LVVCLLVTSLWADEAKKADAKSFHVPFRLTNTKHVLVRAKVNGKGPFNLILDTGAPAVFLTSAVGKKIGVEPEKKGLNTFDRFEVEGGVVVPMVKGRVEDLFQLEGMNGMGLAGVELHGIIGYNVLARYRIELDLTKDRMVWTPLAFEPPAPQGVGGKGVPASMDALAGLMKLMGALLGKKLNPDEAPRGFLGVELADGEGAVTVKAVLEKGPAAQAGVQAGDRITAFQGKAVKARADIEAAAAKLAVGEEAKLTVTRGMQTHNLTVKTGEGL
jgi:membrane-associated protease RseP (regulator of RpoE activity)